MKTPEHILIINYDFPPNEGIGGRRWAKFSKQLAIEGYHIHVIKADAVNDKNISTWSSDVIHENIHIYSLPRKYPIIFSHPKPDLISRVMYRFQKLRLEIQEKGTIYDISIGWKNSLQQKMRELISSYPIVNVIATGAPWKMLADVAEMKTEFPQINLIVDYRDPWLNALNYGMKGLSTGRKKEEERKQTLILENASVIISPYAYLTAELKQWSADHCKQQSHFEVLTHFFDPDDLTKSIATKRDQLTLIYGGDLYQGIEKELEQIKNELLELKENNPTLYAKLRIKIFTNKHGDKTFEGLTCVEINAGVGKLIFSEMSAADVILIILPQNKRNDRTTKFFESLPLRKPFMVVSESGEVTKFVSENKLGFILNSTEGKFETILQNITSGTHEFDAEFDIQPYSLKNVTRKLMDLFK